MREFFNFTSVLCLLFLTSCSSGDEVIAMGERENIFSYDSCKECYSDKLNNKSIYVKNISKDNKKLLKNDFSFDEINSFNLGRVSSRRTGKNFIITPVVKGDVIYTLDSEFVIKGFSLEKNDLIFEKRVLSKNQFMEEEMPVGFSIDEDRIFISSSNGRVMSVSLKDGSVLWNKILDKKVFKSAPAVSKKYVFVLASDNILYSFRKIGGSDDFTHKGLPVLTSFEKGAKVSVDKNQNIIVPFSNGEIHYLTSRGKFLFAKNVKNYRGVKEANLLMDIIGEPVVDNDKLIVAGMANSLKVINLRNSEVIWEKDLKLVSKPVVSYGYVFVQDEDSNVFSIGEDSAKVYWKSKLPELEDEATWFGPVENSGKLIFVSSDGSMLIIDMKNGKTLFKEKIYDVAIAQEAIVSGENIILTMENGEIKILR